MMANIDPNREISMRSFIWCGDETVARILAAPLQQETGADWVYLRRPDQLKGLYRPLIAKCLNFFIHENAVDIEQASVAVEARTFYFPYQGCEYDQGPNPGK